LEDPEEASGMQTAHLKVGMLNVWRSKVESLKLKVWRCRKKTEGARRRWGRTYGIGGGAVD